MSIRRGQLVRIPRLDTAGRVTDVGAGFAEVGGAWHPVGDLVPVKAERKRLSRWVTYSVAAVVGFSIIGACMPDNQPETPLLDAQGQPVPAAKFESWLEEDRKLRAECRKDGLTHATCKGLSEAYRVRRLGLPTE